MIDYWNQYFSYIQNKKLFNNIFKKYIDIAPLEMSKLDERQLTESSGLGQHKQFSIL